MTNLLLILVNELEKFSLQVFFATFANEPWKENFLGNDFRQNRSKFTKTGKLIPWDWHI